VEAVLIPGDLVSHDFGTKPSWGLRYCVIASLEFRAPLTRDDLPPCWWVVGNWYSELMDAEQGIPAENHPRGAPLCSIPVNSCSLVFKSAESSRNRLQGYWDGR
jgi:hypothetical protein